MPKPPRAALYARVSTRDRQDPQNQLQALKDYAQAAGLVIVGEYIDHESGAVPDRPEFQRMMQDAARRQFDQVLFWSLDRLSRGGVKTTLDILQTFQTYGVKFRSLQQPELDTTGPWADVIIAIFAALAKLERDLLRERTKAGIERARREGTTIGRPHAIADLETMRTLRSSGATYEQIAAKLHVSASTVFRRCQDLDQVRLAKTISAAAKSNTAPLDTAAGGRAGKPKSADSAGRPDPANTSEPAKSWK